MKNGLNALSILTLTALVFVSACSNSKGAPGGGGSKSGSAQSGSTGSDPSKAPTQILCDWLRSQNREGFVVKDSMMAGGLAVQENHALDLKGHCGEQAKIEINLNHNQFSSGRQLRVKMEGEISSKGDGIFKADFEETFPQANYDSNSFSADLKVEETTVSEENGILKIHLKVAGTERSYIRRSQKSESVSFILTVEIDPRSPANVAVSDSDFKGYDDFGMKQLHQQVFNDRFRDR